MDGNCRVRILDGILNCPGVYMITCEPIEGIPIKKYIGSSTNLLHRITDWSYFIQGRRAVMGNYKTNTTYIQFWDLICKYGAAAFKIEILKYCDSKQEAHKYELQLMLEMDAKDSPMYLNKINPPSKYV